MTRPDLESVGILGAGCVDRGLYEAWAPAAELTQRHDFDFAYDLAPSELAR